MGKPLGDGGSFNNQPHIITFTLYSGNLLDTVYPPYKGIQQGGYSQRAGARHPMIIKHPLTIGTAVCIHKAAHQDSSCRFHTTNKGRIQCLVKQPKIHSLNSYPQEEPVCFQKDLCFFGINLFMLSYFA